MNEALKHQLKIEMERIGPYKNFKNHLILVKVGSPDWPATQDDMLDVEESLGELLKGSKENIALLVTHHAVKIEIHPLRLEEGETRVVTVGDEERPAAREDLDDMKASLKKLKIDLADTQIKNGGEDVGDQLV